MTHEDQMNAAPVRAMSPRRLAKVAVVALGIAAFGIAGYSGAVAHGGGDDDWVFGASGASGGSGGSGWDDDGFFPSGGSGVFGGSGGSGGSGWDD